MFRLLKKWSLLPWPDRFMFFKIFCLTGIVRAIILILPFKWVAGYLGEQCMESLDEEEFAKLEVSQKIGRAIEMINRHTIWESKCLVQAITGKILMRNRGIDNTLYLGVKKNEKNELVAHAWLRVGPAIITGRSGTEGFTTVACFADCLFHKNEGSCTGRRYPGNVIRDS